MRLPVTIEIVGSLLQIRTRERVTITVDGLQVHAGRVVKFTLALTRYSHRTITVRIQSETSWAEYTFQN